MYSTEKRKWAKKFMPVVLRRYRDAAGISQQELVNRVGISKGFYSSLEMGKRAPNIDLLISIAKALGVRPGEMLDAMIKEAERFL